MAQQKSALLELIERLGFVQVDSIRTVERAHHMILFARLASYRPRHLQSLLEDDRTLFENWTHDASIIPSRFYPYWRHRFTRERERLLHRWRKHRPQGIADIDAVLAAIHAHGEVRSRDMAPPKPAAASAGKGWWDWHPSKAALEYLWRTGQLAVSRREAFQKVYDLSERVIPAHFHTHRQDMSEDEIIDWSMNAALDRLGLATSGELAAFFALITPAQAQGWIRENRAVAGLLEVEVRSADGSRSRTAWARENVLDALADLQAPPQRLRVLSPFDPVLRDRARMQRLFGFEYRIEVFVPAARRRYGYYVFPLLEGDRLVGRIDMRCDRNRDALLVRALWWERGLRPSKLRQRRLGSELERLRRFIGVAKVVFEDSYLRPVQA